MCVVCWCVCGMYNDATASNEYIESVNPNKKECVCVTYLNTNRTISEHTHAHHTLTIYQKTHTDLDCYNELSSVVNALMAKCKLIINKFGVFFGSAVKFEFTVKMRQIQQFCFNKMIGKNKIFSVYSL